jgi:hypothetical protein
LPCRRAQIIANEIQGIAENAEKDGQRANEPGKCLDWEMQIF